MTHSSVHIQIAPESVPSVPSWFGEVAIVAELFTTSGLLTTIEEHVRFVRPRFGTYEAHVMRNEMVANRQCGRDCR
jgi:hypothetical protein